MTLDFGAILQQAAVIASGVLGSFAVAVVLDILAGILVGLKFHTFDWNKLPSFLESQFGTQKAAALLGLVVAAVSTAAGAALLKTGLTSQALQAIADAALGAATVGASAMLLSVLSDFFGKVRQLIGQSVPPPMVRVPTLPITPPAAPPPPATIPPPGV